MKSILLTSVFLSCTFINLGFARIENMKIVDILEPESAQQDYNIFGSNGKVYTIDPSHSHLIIKAKNAFEENTNVQVELSSSAQTEDLLEIQNEIFGISLLTMDEKPVVTSRLKSLPSYGQVNFLNDYVTDVKESVEPNLLFSRLRDDTRFRSQCYNRAHMWAWELSQRFYEGRRIQAGKTWLFFTRKYIRENKYKWWFHVAPFVTFENKVKVLDRTFADWSQSLGQWTNNFMEQKQRCPVVNRYSDYKENQFSNDCYVILSSVHYWQPFQLENAENTGVEQTEWNYFELKKAYRNAVWEWSVPFWEK